MGTIESPKRRTVVTVVTALLFSLQASELRSDDTDALYDRHHLLDVRIELPSRDWDELCGQNRNLVESLQAEPSESPFRYFKASVTIDGTRIDSVGIRKKGFLGSLDTNRPSLKLNLDRFVDGVRFCGTDKLTLNNCKQDQSFLSQWLTYRIYRRAGLPAPRLNLAKVSVNGKNLGIYANVEPVKRRFLQRAFGNSDGALYEGTLADFIPGRLSRFEHKRGPDDRKQITQLAQILAADELDVATLRKVVDVDQFTRFWALESLICFWDGYCNNQNNYFVYVDPRDEKLRFIPWGADVSWSKGVLSFLFKRGNTQSVHARAQLPNALLRNKTTQEKYFAELNRILDDCWDESEFLAETDLVEELVGDAIPDWQRPGFVDALATVRRFIKGRRKEIRDELKKGKPETPEPSVPATAEAVGTVTIKLDGKWNGTLSETPISVPAESVEIQFENKDGLEFESMTLVIGAKEQQQDPNIDRDACFMRFRGLLKKNQRPVILDLMMTRKSFRPDNTYPASIQGTLTEGEGFSLFNPTVEHGVAGSIDVQAAAVDDDAPVSGTITLKIYRVDW